MISKTIQFSSAQPNKTLRAHCIRCPSPQSKSRSILNFLPLAHLHLSSPPFPPANSTLLSESMCLCATYVRSLENPFTFFHLVPQPRPSDSCQSVPCIHASVSFVFISLFCSLDSTYKWDHMVYIEFKLLNMRSTIISWYFQLEKQLFKNSFWSKIVNMNFWLCLRSEIKFGLANIFLIKMKPKNDIKWREILRIDAVIG